MGARSSGREAALQMLFAVEAAAAPPEQVLRDFWREFPGDAEGRPYSESLVRGVLEERGALDERIAHASEHWRLSRMTRVDRNVLRLGTWELLHEMDTPRAVILDEAVELAKRFGTEDSGAFVNGVLGRVADESGRPPEPEGIGS
jgi:transcription antitermination protein NusB